MSNWNKEKLSIGKGGKIGCFGKIKWISLFYFSILGINCKIGTLIADI